MRSDELTVDGLVFCCLVMYLSNSYDRRVLNCAEFPIRLMHKPSPPGEVFCSMILIALRQDTVLEGNPSCHIITYASAIISIVA